MVRQQYSATVRPLYALVQYTAEVYKFVGSPNKAQLQANLQADGCSSKVYKQVLPEHLLYCEPQLLSHVQVVGKPRAKVTVGAQVHQHKSYHAFDAVDNWLCDPKAEWAVGTVIAIGTEKVICSAMYADYQLVAAAEDGTALVTFWWHEL
jgi:hypothetical protein